MKTVIVFTQNLKLESFNALLNCLKNEEGILFVTTHFLFENERKFLLSLFNKCVFKTFADYLTDKEMETCDTMAYKTQEMPYQEYLQNLKRAKNEIVVNKVILENNPVKKYILSDDLGIDVKSWRKKGFIFIKGSYYFENGNVVKDKIKNFVFNFKAIYRFYNNFREQKVNHVPEEVNVGFFEGRKYVFLGKLSRIGYRLNIDFYPSESECDKLNRRIFEAKEDCTYMTTWHEHSKCNIPDDNKYEVRWAQDGYLPPNYSHRDYFFKPRNVKYYCWDNLGTKLFENQGLPYEMIPFRKKLYLPNPKFPKLVKNILIVASGSGDWTALKNRSDDDIMVDAFVQMAKKYPDINFTYRCHPTWVHPLNVGVNSINRVHEYFKWLKLPNLKLSSNIPIATKGNDFQLSFSRSSLDEDLKSADIVFGEHSISMIDAAFKGIPFASVNLTNRRNFFIGINDLGFPSCNSHDEIAMAIERISNREYQENYLGAVRNYNRMTDE